MELPPATGGPEIDLTLDYSSGSVDGRTTATNNQPSWAGEGFDFAPGGSIERRYASCGSKSEQSGTNGTKPTGDLCWATDNATFTLNGKGGEFVRDDQTGAWKPRLDDGTTIQRITDTSKNNGDNDGEYWVLTNADGTKYYFGLNRLPGWTDGKEETRSTWTVPVFGNHGERPGQPQEPCYNASFANAHCRQAYRWNLDYVVDKHGNTMSLFYDVENNYYARFMTATAVSQYERAGSLKRIDYGQRDGAVYTTDPVGRVLMTTAERCIGTCTTSTPSTYPDTPLDQACNSSTNCNNKFNPTFWTQKRLAKITTQVKRASGFDDVDSWSFRHSFPSPGDGTRPGLWLDGITNTGLAGSGSAGMPEINFDGIALPNRVAGTDGIPTMNWWRIKAIHYGTGGEIAVAYSEQDCSLPGNVPAPDTNGKRCHPVKWTPDGQAERQDWFNKYVVTQVTESDRVSALEPVVTSIEYLSPPAWRHDEEDGLVEIGRKTWAQWRGYEHIRTTKGNSTSKAVTEQRFFRGMDGDKLASGGVKDVKVKDSTGALVEDLNPLSGQLREQSTYDNGRLVDRTLNEQWVSPARSTRVKPWGTTQSFQVEDAVIEQDEASGTGWRERTATHNYNPADGSITAKNDLNDVSTPADDTCTRYTYVQSSTAGLRQLPSREHVVSKSCDKTWTKDDVIKDQLYYYDNHTSVTDAPSKGDLTKVAEVSSFDSAGNPVYKTAEAAEYDTLGRATARINAAGDKTTMEYFPATGPVTKTVVTKPNGHTTVSELDPAWGEETSVTGPDNRTTQTEYDPLGRTAKIWKPGRAKSTEPDISYEYQADGDAAGTVTTKTLQADGSFETEIELLDGLLRPRQTQEPAPGGGRIVTDHIYDSAGREVKENGPYFNDAPVGDQVVLPDEASLPAQKLTTYDGVDRPVKQVFKVEGHDQQITNYRHDAGIHTTEPPAGEQATTKISDLQGRPIELRQYTSGTATGSYDSTKYTYHPAGQLATVTDPAGNKWEFEYDLRGRKVKEVDPDKGTSTIKYDELDQVVSSTDATGTLAYAYDSIGRKTALHEGTLAGPKRAEWTYDTLAKGSPVSATRYVGGQPYTSRVTGYDEGGRPRGVEVVLPASEGALAGKYEVSSTYTADGEQATRKLPGVGGLPAETLEFGYNGQDLPTTLKGAGNYVSSTKYTPFGEFDTVTMAQDGGKWFQQLYEYETGTRRLARVVAQRETLPRRISAQAYEYDPAGNVQKISDTPGTGSTETTDTQCFDYDHLRRLTAAWTPADSNCDVAPAADKLGGPAPYWQSWTFDKVGNRKTETKHALGGNTTSSYEYPAAGQAKPHALNKVTTTGPAGTSTKSFEYDTAGNQSKRTVAGVDEVFGWDLEGHLESVTKAGQKTSFVYGADGNRLLRRDGSGTTLYFGETELLLKPTGDLVGTRYYTHAEKTVAVRVGDKLTWLGNDHHGTPQLAVDAQTQTVQRRRHTPYGEVRGVAPAEWPGQKGFVGGTNDPSTGLVHLEAREYDPSIGRFISVDPLADHDNPQQLNGYAYGNNNPVTYTDPDGRFFWIPLIITAIRLAPVIIRTVQVVTTAVRGATPVIRTIPAVVNHGGRLVNTVQRVTSVVNRVQNVTKKVEQVVKKVKPVVTKTVKQVRAKTQKPTPKQAAKKPASQAKNQAKKDAKNTTNNQKPPPKKPQANAQNPSGQAPSSKVILRTQRQLQRKFKHAKVFNNQLQNSNRKNAAEFSREIHQHINNPATREIMGTYHGAPAIHFLNPSNSLNIITTRGREFVSCWKLEPIPLWHVLTTGKLGGH